ncbi:hypothetical protein VHEMI05504 [[Torrubiella] hemipterigena]|uniref:DUF7907 domain-containing protein n=1 Tax=[Torrubiella] hemipterigena TaxID=1531966 RepID=A0A0A1TJ06_9HYPO|nr:hypothetical protein VHEMI05504 [[Torrubiella] hemipterigena]
MIGATFALAALGLVSASPASTLAFDDGDAMAWPVVKTQKVISEAASALSAAVPNKEVGGAFPIPGFSKAFVLVAHVTDKSRDLNPSVEGYNLIASRDGYASSFVSFEKSTEEDKDLFPSYLPGPLAAYLNGTSNVATDLSKFYNPYGFSLKDDGHGPGLTLVRQDDYPGTPGVTISSLVDLVSELVPHQFLACNETVPKYQDRYLTVLRHLDTSVSKAIPDKCVPVKLFPECRDIDKIYIKRQKNAKKGVSVRCYKTGSDYSHFD